MEKFQYPMIYFVHFYFNSIHDMMCKGKFGFQDFDFLIKGMTVMWSRAELKGRAKEVLRYSYWSAFLVSLVITIVGGSNGGGGGGGSNSSRYQMMQNEYAAEIFGLVAAAVFVVIVIYSVFRWLIGFPLEVGGRKYFIQAAQGNVNLNYLGDIFRRERYLNVVLVMFYRGLLLFLWTLLFIIPGIIKGYAYRMVPYILAENPGIGHKRAIELSDQMTMGHKMDMFILDLSFIGWYLLGAMALGIGVLFVRPYEDSTNAELYLTLRRIALERNMCTLQELCGQNNPNGSDGSFYC